MTRPITTCATGRCAYGTDCTCAHYAGWIIVPPRSPKKIRSGGYRAGYRDGHRIGYAAGFHAARQGKKVA